MWASSRENLSLAFPTKFDSSTSAPLHRQARKLNYNTFHAANNKGADKSAWMRRLVCAFVVPQPPKTGFLASRSMYHANVLI